MKKKIIILTSNYPKNKDDVNGIYIKDFNQALSKNSNYNVTIIHNYFKSLREISVEYFLKYFLRNDVFIKNKMNHYIHYLISPFFDFIKLYLDRKLTTKILIDYIKLNGRPDIVICQFAYPCATTANYIYDKFNIPYIIIEHSTGFFTNIYSKYQINKIKSSMMSAKKVIAVSHHLKNKLKKIFQLKNIKAIGNIIDFKTFLIEKKSKSHTKRFTIIAQLEKKKQIDRLLKVFNNINIKNFNFKLNIVGHGTQYKQLYTFVKLNALNKKVHFKYVLNRKKISKLFKHTDYLISCSSIETFGISICEGLASGTPVLAIDSGGPRDFIKKKNCLIVNNFNDLELEIIKIIQNKTKKFSRNYLRESIKKKYTHKKIIEQYNTILSEI